MATVVYADPGGFMKSLSQSEWFDEQLCPIRNRLG
jgi:hypothetical protein